MGVSGLPHRLAAAGVAVLLVMSAAVGATAAGRANADPPPGSPALPQPPWTDNLFIGDRASFDHSVGKWSPSAGARLTHVREPRQAGDGAIGVTNLTRNFGTIYAASGDTPGTYVNATPGARYSFSFWARGSTRHHPVLGELVFLDAHGTQLGDIAGMPRTDFTDRWVHVTNTVAIAPPTARYVIARATAQQVWPGESVFFDSAVIQRARGGERPVAGPLHTSGTKIVDSNGHVVRLRGFNRQGMQGGPIESLPNKHEISQAKTWGANLFRLALGEQKWPGLPQDSCHVDNNYPTKVDNAVNLITGMGIYVLLTLHTNEIKKCGPARPQPMADCNPGACNALAFWTALANRYKSNPLVGFDLYNEPHNIGDSVWRNGGKVTYNGVTFTAAGMQQMYNSVRATGATNLVFVTGLVWGNQFPASGPISGTNIVYAAHAYTCPGAEPPACTNSAPFDPSQFLNKWVQPGKRFPVIVAEFGWPASTNSWYAQNVISFAEAQGWSWADFVWGPNPYSRFSLYVTIGIQNTYEPAPGGMPAAQTFAGN